MEIEFPETGVTYTRDDFLSTMSATACLEASQALSPAGREVFEMLLYAKDRMELTLVEAFKESAAFDALASNDQDILMIWLARLTLIEEFRTFEG